jgi:hypothetical protein
VKIAPPLALGNDRGKSMKHQVKYLMHRHALTEAQASAIVALIWGAIA